VPPGPRQRRTQRAVTGGLDQEPRPGPVDEGGAAGEGSGLEGADVGDGGGQGGELGAQEGGPPLGIEGY